MTDEQIKQNAEEYAKAHTPLDNWETDKALAKFAFIAGAHSRNEEIAGYQTQINMTADALQQCVDELEQLRNPWISVEKRLPEKWKRIKVYSGTGEACWAWVSKTVFVNAKGWDNDPEKAFYDFDSKIWWSEYGDNIANLFGAPEYWMPIPELKKG